MCADRNTVRLSEIRLSEYQFFRNKEKRVGVVTNALCNDDGQNRWTPADTYFVFWIVIPIMSIRLAYSGGQRTLHDRINIWNFERRSWTTWMEPFNYCCLRFCRVGRFFLFLSQYMRARLLRLLRMAALYITDVTFLVKLFSKSFPRTENSRVRRHCG